MIAPTARGRRVLASLPVIVLTACGTTPLTTAGPPSSVATTTVSSSTTTTAATTTVPTTVAALPLPAADGTNLDACTDGTCEVSVKEGDVPAVPVGPLTVAVGGSQAGVGPDPSIGMTDVPAGPTGWVGILDDQVFTVGTVQDGQAVLRLYLR